MTNLPICTLDVETRSAVDLRKTGPWPYSEDPTTDLWCACWAIGDGDVMDWVPGDPVPQSIVDHMAAGGWFEFHNADFEVAIWRNILTPRYGWPELILDQVSDTMVRACVMGLPRSLEQAGEAMKLDMRKDKRGHNLMMQMAKPRKARKGEDPDVLRWWDDADRVSRLIEYCRQDVRSQRELGDVLRPLTPDERASYLRTLKANVRGIRIDREFVDQAVSLLQRRAADYEKEISELTNYAVTRPTQVAEIKEWLAAQGVELETLDKNHLADLIDAGGVPDDVLPVVDIRAQGGKSSTKKFPAFANHVCADSRIRGEFIHHGAGKTGRFAGSGVQLHNLPARGGLPWHSAEEVREIVREFGRAEQLGEASELIELLYEPVPTALSSTLRGTLMASPGKSLYCADYSNIEGRFAAWLAGERWKLQAFRDFDAGTGADLYKVAAAGILGCKPEDVDKVLRNALGKVSELALQFQGGVGAFLAMAKTYRVEIGDYWDIIRENVDDSVLERTLEAWESRGQKSDTDKTTWIAAEAVKVAWRDRHPGISQAWRDCEDAAVSALRNVGSAHFACNGKIGFQARRISDVPFLLQRLPSGRLLYLAYPWLEEKTTPWGTKKPQINYFGVESQSRKWKPFSTYGGDLFQSATQGGACDIMRHGWANLEDEGGYDMLLNVHDELAGEHSDGNLDEFCRLMSRVPDWAEGLPVVAEGYEADRYRKD